VEWLNVKQVVQLDSAFCGTCYTQFSLTAYGHRTVLPVSRCRTFAQVVLTMRWSILKNAQLDGIHITEGISRRTLSTFLTISKSAVRWVNSSDCDNQMQKLLEIGRWCPNVQWLHVTSWRQDPMIWDDCLGTLTLSFGTLAELALCGSVNLSSKGLAAALSHCRCLESVHIRNKSQEIPVEIALPTLKSITVKSVHMSDSVLIAIGQRCVKLETLNVFNYYRPEYRVTDVGVRAVLQGCPLLRETDVEYAASISGELRVELARRRDFKSLDLYYWTRSNELAQEVLKFCPNLTELRCSYCPGITDATLLLCAHHCPPLMTILLRECPLVTSHSVCALVTKAGDRLRTIECIDCPELGDETALAIAERCPLLENFSIIPPVSDAAVTKLVKCCVHLRSKPTSSDALYWRNVCHRVAFVSLCALYCFLMFLHVRWTLAAGDDEPVRSTRTMLFAPTL
jgi:hypothetical protein